MELIFSDALYDTADWEEGKYSKELFSHIVQIDPEASVTDTNIGHGADWPVVLVELFKGVDWSQVFTVAGVGGVFLLGKQINENIDAWIEIGKKIRKLIEKMKPARVDEYAAVLLVINDLKKMQSTEWSKYISTSCSIYAGGMGRGYIREKTGLFIYNFCQIGR